MSDAPTLGELVLGLSQVVLTLLVAPLLLGITKRVKARLQYRRGPSLLQPYRDLAKWWGKESVESDAASPLTGAAPAIVLAAVVVATLLVPIVGARPPLAGWGDLLVVIGLMALGRFLLALSALDAGSAFGGMGSSREVAIATLVEPALLLALDRRGRWRPAPPTSARSPRSARRRGPRGTPRRSSSPPARSRSSPSPRPATSLSTIPIPISS